MIRVPASRGRSSLSDYLIAGEPPTRGELSLPPPTVQPKGTRRVAVQGMPPSALTRKMTTAAFATGPRPRS